MSDHNITRVDAGSLDTVIATGRCRLIAVLPEAATTAVIELRSGVGDATQAEGLITVEDGGTEGDTLTVGAITLTLDDTPTGEDQLATEATAAELRDAVLAALLAHSSYNAENWTAEAGAEVDEINIVNTESGNGGNTNPFDQTGTTFTLDPSGGFLEGGTSGDVVLLRAAAGLAQTGKAFSNAGVRCDDGITLYREDPNTDSVGVVWAAGHNSL